MTKAQKAKQILAEVLSEIKPTKEMEKETLKKVNALLNEINKKLKENGLKAKAVLGGSYAKGTWVKGDYDVDIFVKFDLKYKDKNLSDLLHEALKNTVHDRVHGSRDYFLYKKEGISYEIIPVLDIKRKEEAQNITDFSPWHVDWVNKQGKKIKDDIMILKKFMKAQKIYGAENYIKGFSGHVVDILTIYYGGFWDLLKDAQKWKDAQKMKDIRTQNTFCGAHRAKLSGFWHHSKPSASHGKKIIDKNNVYKGKALMMMNKSKTEGPLVLVDPVMAERNAAAAVDDQTFEKFATVAKEFLKKPSKDFFEEKTVDFKTLEKKGHLIIIGVKSLEGKEDVVGTKIMKVYEWIKEKLDEFYVIESEWEWDKNEKGLIWYVLKKEKLEEDIEIKGPPLKIKEHVQAFKKMHKKTFEKKGRIYALDKREHVKPEDIINKTIKEKYVQEKIKDIKMVGS